MTCFAGRLAPEGVPAGRYCQRKSPAEQVSLNALWPWKEVRDDGWCADGADRITLISFSAGIGPGIIGPQGPKGDQGIQGSAGVNAPAWSFGSTDPNDNNGNDDDFYMKFTAGTTTLESMWRKTNGSWHILLDRFPV